MDNSPMLSTPFPETILCDGHSSASGTTAFATCKSLHLNFCRVLPKVSFRYLLVEDKQGTSVVKSLGKIFTTEAQRSHREPQRGSTKATRRIFGSLLENARSTIECSTQSFFLDT